MQRALLIRDMPGGARDSYFTRDLIYKLLRDPRNPRAVSRYSPIATPLLVCIKKKGYTETQFYGTPAICFPV